LTDNLVGQNDKAIVRASYQNRCAKCLASKLNEFVVLADQIVPRQWIKGKT
jgi:hypothetical protein